jgi:hypothetical protein
MACSTGEDPVTTLGTALHPCLTPGAAQATLGAEQALTAGFMQFQPVNLSQ